MFLLLWLIFRDKITAGQYMAMLFYSFFIFGPLQDLGNIILSFREAEASMNNFHALMQKPVEVQPLQPVHLGLIETLAFEHVGFQHRSANQRARAGHQLPRGKGKTIAFVGPSGSGKTTLMKLLVGLYQPQEGRITYNDIDSKEIQMDDLRKQIGFVTQDTQLFSGSIKENLLFVNPEASDTDIMEALHSANCDRLLARTDRALIPSSGKGA